MNQNETKKPFFARFMESQNRQTIKEEQGISKVVVSYDEATTLKYPSDRDEDPGGGDF